MNAWHDVTPGPDAPRLVDCIIEIPRLSRLKYELDKKSGLLRLDRVLYSAVFYPHNYGFIPQTYCDDHDPLDILVLGQEAVQPMCILTARPIGVMRMIDQNEEDDKIIAVHQHDPAVAHLQDIFDLPQHTLNELQRFFEDYKALENKRVRIEHFQSRDEALNIVDNSLRLYNQSFAPGGSKRPDAPVLASDRRALEQKEAGSRRVSSIPSAATRLAAAQRAAATNSTLDNVGGALNNTFTSAHISADSVRPPATTPRPDAPDSAPPAQSTTNGNGDAPPSSTHLQGDTASDGDTLQSSPPPNS